MQQHPVDLLITAVVVAAGHLAECKTRESELDGQRPHMKSEAIARLMGQDDPRKSGKYSATAAAEVVALDPAFALLESDRRNATAATIRAMGEYEAAKFRAELAISGARVAIIDDEALVVTIGKDHAVEIRRAS